MSDSLPPAGPPTSPSSEPLQRGEGSVFTPRLLLGGAFIILGNLAAIVAIFLPWARFVTSLQYSPNDLEVSPLTVVGGNDAWLLTPFCVAYLALVLLMTGSSTFLLLLSGDERRGRTLSRALAGIASTLILAMAFLLLLAYSSFSLAYPYYTTTLRYGVGVAAMGAVAVLVGISLFPAKSRKYVS